MKVYRLKEYYHVSKIIQDFCQQSPNIKGILKEHHISNIENKLRDVEQFAEQHIDRNLLSKEIEKKYIDYTIDIHCPLQKNINALADKKHLP